jgi:hypothetical protein
MISQHAYEVRPRKDRRGVNLIFEALPFGRLLVRRAGKRCPMHGATAAHESEEKRRLRAACESGIVSIKSIADHKARIARAET